MNHSAEHNLILERRGDVQWLLFDRPRQRNALTWAMYDGLVDACAMVNADRTIKAMVIAGTEQVFAAGTDIAQFKAFRTEQDAIEYEAHSNRVNATLEAVRVPVIAAIAGACTGGGAAIASCCDLRIATPSTRFGIPIARTLGNCLSHENYARIVALVGFPRATEILMTGRLMGAEELRAAGIVVDVVPDSDLFPRAQELAETVGANAPLTLEVTKRALHLVRNRLFPPEDDAEIIRTCYLSRDFQEGVAAFLAKRKPVWRGE